jgi:hypothetical protein
MTPEAISVEYFTPSSQQSVYVCLHVYHPVVARQRFCNIVTVAINTNSVIEELSDASFAVRSVSYEIE